MSGCSHLRRSSHSFLLTQSSSNGITGSNLLWKSYGKKLRSTRTLEFCTFGWKLNPRLLGALICFWSPSAYCFFLRSGPMSVTLLDVYAISELTPSREDPSLFDSSAYPDFPKGGEPSYARVLNDYASPKGAISSLLIIQIPLFSSFASKTFSLSLVEE